MLMELRLETAQGRSLLALLVRTGERVPGLSLVHDEREPLLALYEEGRYLTMARLAMVSRLEESWRASADVSVDGVSLGGLKEWALQAARVRPSPPLRPSALSSAALWPRASLARRAPAS